MVYKGYKISPTLSINKIFSIHYFEYTKDFDFPGEQHDFWEFVYVDKGAVCARGGDLELNLIRGDIIFHEPNEFHSLHAYGKIAPNLVVMSFSAESPGINWFRRKVVRIGNQEQELLARIIHEAGNAFSSDLSDPWLPRLKKRPDQVFASEQLIRIYLEQFLISIVRRSLHIDDDREPVSPLREKTDKDAFNRAIEFINNNLVDMVNLDAMCRSTGYSCTYLEQVFKNKTGRSVMEYYKVTKLERAKDLIRTGDYSFTQIASVLNYSSVQYFSKVFKRFVGMTPSEYSSSVKFKLT